MSNPFYNWEKLGSTRIMSDGDGTTFADFFECTYSTWQYTVPELHQKLKQIWFVVQVVAVEIMSLHPLH